MEPYSDSPTAPHNTPSPTSSDSSATIKPLPMLPTYVEEEDEEQQPPYHDNPPTPTETHPARYHRASLPSRHPPRYYAHPQNPAYRPYIDEAPPPPPSPAPPPSDSDDDVPLAHLLLHPQLHTQAPFQVPPYQPHQPYPLSPSPPYPLDAPPSYSVAVRHSHSYHSTLIQHIPGPQQYHVRDPLVVEIDEESGVELMRADSMRHSVEHVVAMFVVASLLLLIAAVLGWLAFGSGVFR